MNKYKRSNWKYDYYATFQGMASFKKKRFKRALKKKAQNEFNRDFEK